MAGIRTDAPAPAVPLPAARGGVLAVTAPALVALAPERAPGAPLVYGAALVITVGLLLRLQGRGVGRGLFTGAVLVGFGFVLQDRLDRPAAVLALLVTWMGILSRMWPSAALADVLRRRAPSRPARGLRTTASAALMALLLVWIAGPGHLDALDAVAVSLVAWTPLAYAPRRALRSPGVARFVAAIAPLFLLGPTIAGYRGVEPWLLSVGPLALLLARGTAPDHGDREVASPLDVLLANSTLALVGSFGLACLFGTALLSLPGVTFEPIALIDAAFTAVSAICITGLTVLETPEVFTPFGQVLLLLLVQIGGLGIMTFSSAIWGLLGRRMSVLYESAATELVGAEARSDLLRAVHRIVRVVFATEAAGALLLWPLFVRHGDGWGEAAWRAVFTSVSAFCNAGFALQPDSLHAYRSDPIVLLVVGAVVLVGSLGPVVVVGLPAWLRGEAVSLHVRLVLVTNLWLLLVPAVLFAVVEWTNTLGALSTLDKLVNATFTSITLRSAGYTSIDVEAVHPATWTLMLAAMFIGGSPGSSAGGVKTTTFAILIVAVTTAIRGRQEVRAYGRRLPHATVYQAASIGAVGVASVVVALFVVLLTQDMSLRVAAFEVVSALGTVGLTLGGTAELDDVGKVLIMACIFAGRVGPVALFAILSGVEERSRIRYPEARVPVG